MLDDVIDAEEIEEVETGMFAAFANTESHSSRSSGEFAENV